MIILIIASFYDIIQTIMAKFYRLTIAVLIGLTVTVFFYTRPPAISAPLLANYFLGTLPTDSASVAELAKFDLLILSPEQGVVRRSVIDSIKQLNPDVILLAYVPSQSWSSNWQKWPQNAVFGKFEMQSNWWLTDPVGNKVSDWPGLLSANMSRGWSDYLISFTQNNILSQGIWDGVFWDAVYDGISQVNGGNIDLNQDGVKDSAGEVNAEWQARIAYLLGRSKERLNVKYIMMNGSSNQTIQSYVSGRMYENFPTPWEAGGQWSGIMSGLKRNQALNAKPELYVFNTNTSNTGKRTDYKKVRFGYASSLMLNDVYFSFDYGDKDHGQIWWYDEYNQNLGDATSIAKSISGEANTFTNEVWRRDYANGIALVNPTSQTVTVNLDGDYEHLIGQQDPVVNSGRIVDKVTVAAKDGVILRKTLTSLDNLYFFNGSFTRFYSDKGYRARNGFFTYAANVAGGAGYYRGDLDQDGNMESIQTNGSKLEIYNSTGGLWQSDWPLGRKATKLFVSVGVVNGENRIILSGTGVGSILPMSYYGAPLRDVIQPLGSKYTAGFSNAIGNLDGGTAEIILGTMGKVAGEVLVLDGNKYIIKKRFYPYGAKYTGSVLVAAGDTNGDKKDEIVTLGIINKKATVRIFNITGKKISEFVVPEMFGSSPKWLGALEVDDNGKAEIVVGTE